MENHTINEKITPLSTDIPNAVAEKISNIVNEHTALANSIYLNRNRRIDTTLYIDSHIVCYIKSSYKAKTKEIDTVYVIKKNKLTANAIKRLEVAYNIRTTFFTPYITFQLTNPEDAIQVLTDICINDIKVTDDRISAQISTTETPLLRVSALHFWIFILLLPYSIFMLGVFCKEWIFYNRPIEFYIILLFVLLLCVNSGFHYYYNKDHKHKNILKWTTCITIISLIGCAITMAFSYTPEWVVSLSSGNMSPLRWHYINAKSPILDDTFIFAYIIHLVIYVVWHIVYTIIDYEKTKLQTTILRSLGILFMIILICLLLFSPIESRDFNLLENYMVFPYMITMLSYLVLYCCSISICSKAIK